MNSLRSQFHIAIVDDNKDCLDLISTYLNDSRLKLFCFESPHEFREAIIQWRPSKDSPRQIPFDLVISDIEMPFQNGIELLKSIKSYIAQTPVIFITAHSSVDSAVEAIQLKASDYIKKPFTRDKIREAVYKALPLLRQVVQSEKPSGTPLPKELGIIGEGPRMLHLFDLMGKVAKTDSNILITGESGTGKEQMAQALHRLSHRKDQPFIAVNCAALPESLLESELFGYAKGAFSGADRDKKGLFEAANGGTLFLDEIGEMEHGLQSKLLRVLQEKKVRPLGRVDERPVNCRVICATHQNLRKAINQGRFREDLYFRLAVIPIEVPPLRQRKEDIPALAEFFLSKYSKRYRNIQMQFSEDAYTALRAHSWPGNVRELQNTIERSVVLCDGDTIRASDLYIEYENSQEMDLASVFSSMSLEEIEKQYIKHALSTYGGVKTKAAEVLGMDRKTLYRKEKKYFGTSLNRDY